jgi:hypothetical protein
MGESSFLVQLLSTTVAWVGIANPDGQGGCKLTRANGTACPIWQTERWAAAGLTDAAVLHVQGDPGVGEWLAGSAAVQGRDKQDVVTRLDLVGFLALELPVGVVDENQDAGAAVSVSGGVVRI